MITESLTHVLFYFPVPLPYNLSLYIWNSCKKILKIEILIANEYLFSPLEGFSNIFSRFDNIFGPQLCWCRFETEFLPDTEKGCRVLRLLEAAFNQHLTFTISFGGSSGSADVAVWNEAIAHKTEFWPAKDSRGYPDPNYLDSYLNLDFPLSTPFRSCTYLCWHSKRHYFFRALRPLQTFYMSSITTA